MKRKKYVLPLLAILGLAIAIVVMIDSSRPIEKQPAAIRPSESPYAAAIAGVGIVEADAGNIQIGTSVSGLVTDMYVKVGDRVHVGDALFKIDDRDLRAQLLTANAEAELRRAALQKPLHRLEYLRELRHKDPAAVSAHELTDLEDDLAQARASYALAKAQVKRIETDIAIHTIRAPADGEVLQIRARLGEHVEAGINAQPIMLFGRDDSLHVRVDIDETEIWRYEPGADAVAFARGNPTREIPLEFEYTERYVIPKTSLTGQSTERTDVRVLQVIYSFKKVDPPVYVGEQLDVFIEAQAVAEH